MVFEQIANGGCQSYLVGCEQTHAALVIDPAEPQIDHYLGLAARHGLRLHYVADTHTHADHFSGSRAMSQLLSIPVVMHRAAPAPYAAFRLGHGEILRVGNLRLQALHTPGHTADSMCLLATDHIFTGDTLLIGGTGRTDLPTGDPEALHASLFDVLLTLPDETLVFPAHDYQGRSHSTIGAERAGNPRLQKTSRDAFVAMMRQLNLAAPHPSDRGAAHQYQRRQDDRGIAGGSGRPGAVHVAGRPANPRHAGRTRPCAARCARTRRL